MVRGVDDSRISAAVFVGARLVSSACVNRPATDDTRVAPTKNGLRQKTSSTRLSAIRLPFVAKISVVGAQMRSFPRNGDVIERDVFFAPDFRHPKQRT